MKKQILSILLILALVLTVLPQTALLAEEPACAHEHLAPRTQRFENTRGDFVYLLWQMAGCPEPTIENPWEDVSPTDLFYKAVLWAKENQISNGLTETSFRPEVSQVRGQAVTLLWRAAGYPEPKNLDSCFVDLNSGSYYEKAVTWAAEQDWIDLNAGEKNFWPDYKVGHFLWEGTVCEDCGRFVKTEKLTLCDVLIDQGICGDDLTWSLINGTLTITGSGDMEDFVAGSAPWGAYSNQITSLELPEGLTHIGDYAFRSCSSLEHAEIPAGVTSIGEWAFNSCAALRQLTIPEGVTDIGEGAFSACGSLTDLTIPKRVTSISPSLCMSCTSLEHVTLPEGVTDIGDEAFAHCIALENVTIPDSVTHVGFEAFRDTAYSYDEENWVDGILYLDRWAIDAERSHIEVQFLPGTKGISDALFYDTDILEDVTLPEGLTSIGKAAFAECFCLTDMEIPDSVTRIGDWAFSGCFSLLDVTIPEGVTGIGEGAFNGCHSLQCVELPESVKRIGRYAFDSCDSLAGITITNRECVIEEVEQRPELTLGDPKITALYGYAGSTVQAYAERNGHRFVALSEKVPFVDVPANAFYADPVAWAVDNEITNGVDDTHFGPDRACTRGQVVTFLWRAAGCPAPKSTKTGFLDVKAGAFYETAVAWAVEQGITNGMTDISFAPDATCTRGQIVTFLWRFKGSPAPENTATPFTDLNPKGYYVKAVAWAVENEVTNGMTATTFAPDATCTRGQVVTFLRRAAGE